MTDAHLDKLRGIPIFSSLDDESLGHVAALVTEFNVAKGHVLIERGQPGSGVFIIEQGSVRVDLHDGRQLERGEGTFFGELSVLAATPRTARVTATTDLRCLAIRRDDLMKLLHEEPSIAVAMLQEVAARLAQAD